MSKHKQTLVGLVLLLMGGSCREVYYPEDIESNLKIPVIQGNIMENKAPVVNLSWAIGYEGQTAECISGAIVLVSDNLGNIVFLDELIAGTYTTYMDEFKGVIGNYYTLQVTLPDGSEYTSNAVLLPDNPVIDSLYAVPGIGKVYTYNTSKELIVKEQEGLFVYSELHGYSDNTLYYRFHTKMIKELMYTVELGSPSSHPIFIWEVSWLDNKFTADKTVSQADQQVIRKHPMGFLNYFYNAALQTETQTAPFTIAWILIFNVYSISSDVYEYYHSIGQQLASKDQLFAPVPSQVKGNIKCSSDPGKKVIGVFEASSVTTYYKAFGWKSLKEYFERELDTFPDLKQGGSMPRYRPDFWLTF